MPQTTNAIAQIVLSRSLSPELRILVDVIRTLAAGDVAAQFISDIADRRVPLLIRRLLGSPKKEAATCG
ncbi:hypothetical protein SAMN05877809_102532 [Rhodobacter sp. JA431]|nr:hypothetical protein SAMN05877809_102532 [Rhodobacter sp. JA431]